jgi:Xaa-Pro aminopeptidase
MKKELDALMENANVDALLITGSAMHNPAMFYLTGGGHVTGADLIKKKNEPAVYFHNAMERDEAAKSGLTTRSFSLYPMEPLLKQAGGDRLKAAALRYKKILEDLGFTQGRLALYGQTDLGRGYALFTALKELMPEVEMVGYQEKDIILDAMATKDEQELARIRKMGQVTTQVVGNVADYLTTRQVKDGVLLDQNGSPVTIGRVKSLINLWLAEKGAENPEDCIFSMGFDTGVPHSVGNPQDILRLGEMIIFDIFPCEAGGGYFYDFTRTWCLGYAPEQAQKLYDQVHSVYDTLVSELKMGTHFGVYQERTCELFEAMGHPTVKSQPTTEIGYVHSLGHGVGLHVHERPFSGSTTARPEDVLTPGMVFTLEPGLYYAEEHIGARIEDTLCVNPDGSFEIMADFPKDLVLPVKQ